MRSGGPGRLARAVAVAALGGALAFPAPTRELPRATSESPRAAEQAAAAREEPGSAAGAAGAAGARVEMLLLARLPQLEDPLRRALARTILAESQAARIDPLLVLAVIEVESGWDPVALSGRGARGLMQLREPTLRRELERAGLEIEDPDDPVANVLAGVRYLRRLLDAFGREELALMAYNAGPNRILGYIREGEIPARFHGYPRRVAAELRRLRLSLGVERGAELAQSRVVAEPQ
jgi:soluble lytic murein transglycosylase-like protein